MNIELIVQVAHQTNKAYCESIGDYSQKEYTNASDWQRASAINGVRFYIQNPNAGPAELHENWLSEKKANGWKFGEVKDAAKKEHPRFMPYNELSIEQTVKDNLFISVVNTMKVLLD